MSKCGHYVPVIKAEFGKAITRDDINAEFQEIERVMDCVNTAMQTSGRNSTTIYNHGAVITEITILASDGAIQYATLEGDVLINVSEPGEDDAKIISLMLADGGNGRFIFNSEQVARWTSDAAGDDMDGYPWDSADLSGEYGAIVTLLYDGEGWIAMVYARHDIDYTATADPTDIYRWK